MSSHMSCATCTHLKEHVVMCTSAGAPASLHWRRTGPPACMRSSEANDAHYLSITKALWHVRECCRACCAALAPGIRTMERRRWSPSHLRTSAAQLPVSELGVATTTRRTAGRPRGPWRSSVHNRAMTCSVFLRGSPSTLRSGHGTGLHSSAVQGRVFLPGVYPKHVEACTIGKALCSSYRALKSKNSC